MRVPPGWKVAVAASLVLAAVGAARAQCPPGGGCTEYLGAGRRGSYFRILAITRFPGTNFDFLTVLGFSVLAMGDVVDDPERLNGRRPGWNAGLDYAPFVDPAFDAWVPRFRKGPGRRDMARNTWVDFRRGEGKRVNYPILSFAGREDFICIPEFQKVYDDAATLGGKDHAIVWGSTGGHCRFTPLELRAVVEEYLEWLDGYGTPHADEPTTADVLARCGGPAPRTGGPSGRAPPCRTRARRRRTATSTRRSRRGRWRTASRRGPTGRKRRGTRCPDGGCGRTTPASPSSAISST